MSRMPIRNHRMLSSSHHAKEWQYGGLVEFSLRYTPVTGRLHTRYAPVRRSPAVYCYTPLPLDLHVLSLPLAFILSQDQTLHCKNCSFLPFDSSRVAHISIYVCRHTLSLSSHPFQITLALIWVFQQPVFLTKADAKIQPFSIPTKYFFKKNPTKQHKLCATATYKIKKIIPYHLDGGTKHPWRCKKAQKSTRRGQKQINNNTNH